MSEASSVKNNLASFEINDVIKRTQNSKSNESVCLIDIDLFRNSCIYFKITINPLNKPIPLHQVGFDFDEFIYREFDSFSRIQLMH